MSHKCVGELELMCFILMIWHLFSVLADQIEVIEQLLQEAQKIWRLLTLMQVSTSSSWIFHICIQEDETQVCGMPPQSLSFPLTKFELVFLKTPSIGTSPSKLL